MIRKNKLGQEKKSKIFMPMLSRKAQEEKISFRNFSKLSSKRGQEEIVGFAIILIIVAVILLVVLSSSLRKPVDNIDSNEVTSFIQSSLQYTTLCEGKREKLDIQDLIFECEFESKCENNLNSCDVLEEEVRGILDASWKVGEDYPSKGYEFVIMSNGIEMINISKGEITNNAKGTSQDFAKSSSSVEIQFTVYY